MKLRKALRNLIIGENRYIESVIEYKKVMLSGQVAMIAIAILILNCSFEKSIGLTVLTYLLSITLLAFSIILHRLSKHILANYVMLITVNFTTYLFASSESMSTGICVFFVVVPIGSFIIMNANRLQAYLFGGLSFILFYLSYFVNFRILPWREYTNEEVILIALVNMSVAIISTGMGVSLLIRLNSESASQLFESNKLLVKTNTELDRFVYSTSHDLRAPLTSMMGLINIASSEEDIHELKRYLALMKGRVDSLDAFIKDITDYSRNNRSEVGNENVNVKELAMDVWEDLRFVPEASRISFDVQIPETANVISDKSRLKVILSNLISNAVRYHDTRKESQFIRLVYECNEQGFRLKITDNGQGISKEYHQKIFDMFFRGNETSKGSGLGLYIVKEVLTKLSGSISLDSQPGAGATFTISLPAKCS